ncbi:MAG: hypothetical protein KDD70_13160, partial [Bdellovibrionales bacterium]|nr:hypothetical protein [Bdellovibrionales bacterium]
IGAHSSSIAERTIGAFNLNDMSVVAAFTDPRLNNLGTVQQCIPDPANPSMNPPICETGYLDPSTTWYDYQNDYQQALIGASATVPGMLGRLYAISGPNALLFNPIEYTEDFILDNRPECLIAQIPCISSEGAMTPGIARMAAGQITSTLPLPNIQNVLNQFDNSITQSKVIFHRWADIDVDHARNMAVVGVDISLDGANFDLSRSGVGTFIDIPTGNLHEFATAVAPLTRQEIGKSVAVLGGGQVDLNQNNQPLPVRAYAFGGPGNGALSSAFSQFSEFYPESTVGGVVAISFLDENNEEIDLLIIANQNSNHQYGNDVAATGDLDGDNAPEFIAGAPGGGYAVITSTSDRTTVNSVVLFAPQGSSNFGKQVGAAKASNGTTFLLVGADDGVYVYDSSTCYVAANKGNGNSVIGTPSEPGGGNPNNGGGNNGNNGNNPQNVQNLINQGMNVAQQVLQQIQTLQNQGGGNGQFPAQLNGVLNAVLQIVNYITNSLRSAALPSGGFALRSVSLDDYLRSNLPKLRKAAKLLKKGVRNSEKSERLLLQIEGARGSVAKLGKLQKKERKARKLGYKFGKRGLSLATKVLGPVTTAE